MTDKVLQPCQSCYLGFTHDEHDANRVLPKSSLPTLKFNFNIDVELSIQGALTSVEPDELAHWDDKVGIGEIVSNNDINIMEEINEAIINQYGKPYVKVTFN